MKDKILVSIVADHTFESDVNIIGRSGEGGIAQFQITLTEEMSSCEVYLDFELPTGDKFRTEQLTVENNVVTYDVPLYLLGEEGELKVQLVLKSESVGVWKSSVKRYKNLESINAVDEIPTIPVGKIEITSTGEYNVKQYATAQVVDADLIPKNIAKGVSILGIPGTLDGSPALQEKTVTANGEVIADGGYYGLSKVIVNVPAPNKYYGSYDIADAIISFTIDGTTFEAKRGMTWNEFAASEYNPEDEEESIEIGLVFTKASEPYYPTPEDLDDNTVYYDDDAHWLSYTDYTDVAPTDKIKEGYAYIVMT